MDTIDNTAESSKQGTIEIAEAYLRSKYVLFTQDEWRAYKRSALIILALVGIGTVSSAWVAAKRYVDEFARKAGATRIEELTKQAEGNAARIRTAYEQMNPTLSELTKKMPSFEASINQLKATTKHIEAGETWTRIKLSTNGYFNFSGDANITITPPGTSKPVWQSTSCIQK